MHKENPQAQHTSDNGNATLGVVSKRAFVNGMKNIAAMIQLLKIEMI